MEELRFGVGMCDILRLQGMNASMTGHARYTGVSAIHVSISSRLTQVKLRPKEDDAAA